MPGKTLGIISGILTFFLLSIIVFLVTFAQMVLLNGASERQGGTAMGILLVCESITTLVMGFLAGWTTNHLVTKRNWNRIVAVVLPVAIGTLLGLFVSLLSVIIAIPLAGIR